MAPPSPNTTGMSPPPQFKLLTSLDSTASVCSYWPVSPPPPPLPVTNTYLTPTPTSSASIPYYFTPLPSTYTPPVEFALPHTYMHIPPTFQITADVHAPYSAPATTDCSTTTVLTPLHAASTLMQPIPAAIPATAAIHCSY